MKQQTDEIAKQLAVMLDATDDQRTYALIDGALQPKAWAVLSRSFKVASLIPAATENGKSAVSALPFLVLIDGPGTSEAIRLTVELAFEHHAATWLRSPLDLPSLAKHLAPRLQGEIPEMAVMLRFADARILPVLHGVLEPAQASPYFAGITAWWYLQRDMQLSALALGRADNDQMSSDPFMAPLVLTAEQENRLMQACEPDTVISLIEQHDTQALLALPKPQHYQFVKEKLIEARNWNITSTADQALFCMIALEHSPESLTSETWQKAFQQVKTKRITLMQALEQTTP